jgi:hypothetical protein
MTANSGGLSRRVLSWVEVVTKNINNLHDSANEGVPGPGSHIGLPHLAIPGQRFSRNLNDSCLQKRHPSVVAQLEKGKNGWNRNELKMGEMPVFRQILVSF